MPTTDNPFLARFESSPAFVAEEMKGVFESSLHQAALVQARLDADASAPQMVDDFWFAETDWRSQFRPYVVKDGVLQIPVKGVLLHDFPYAFGSWATGYVYIRRAFERGMDDGSVRGIALVIDSPGGEVAGNFDLVDRMFERRGEKPVRAYAAESAYSAAYSIASVADSITVSRTGGVGSIGVVTAHVDVSKLYEDVGYKITFIFAGKHKVDGNAYEPLPVEVKKRIQTRIDELYGVFVATVARNRGMDEQAIRDTEALTFTATQATKNGLADAIGALDDALADFSASFDAENDGDADMANPQDTGKKTGTEGDEAAVNAAREDGKAIGRKEGAAAERERINTILGSEEGKKRPKAALSAALKTDMTTEQAAAFLGDLPEEQATAPAQNTNDGKPQGKTTFEKAMEQTGNPDLAAGSGDENAEDKMPRHERAMRMAGHKPKAA